MVLPEAIETFLAHRRQAGRMPGTLALYRRQLMRWELWREQNAGSPDLALMPGDALVADLRAFFASLHDQRPPLAPASLASYHRTIRAFWYFASDEGLISATHRDAFRRIARPSVPKRPRKAIEKNVIDALLQAAGSGQDERSARNRAIILMLEATGMRIAELCSLTDEATDIQARRARIIGKGNKPGTVFWGTKTSAALARYQLVRRGSYGGPLFRGCSSRNKGDAITPDLVRSLMKRLAERAGVKLVPGAPLHSFRHRFAHEALSHGADISEVSQLMRHSSIVVTMEYLRSDDDHLQAIYDEVFRRRRAARFWRQDREASDG